MASWHNQNEPAPELVAGNLEEGTGSLQEFRRACSKIFCGLSCSRICNYTVFFCVCLASLLGQVAPVMVATVDTGTMLILYLVCHADQGSFHFSTSLLDVVLLSVARTIANLTAYLGCGDRQNCHKPYLYTTYASLVITLCYVFVKVFKYEYTASSDDTWAAVLMFLISSISALAHMLCAQSINAAAKKRRKAQLTSTRYAPTEKDWLMEGGGVPGYSTADLTAGSGGGAGSGASHLSDSDSDDESPDLPAKAFVDSDSRFVTCEGVEIHYKISDPEGGSAGLPPQDTTAVLLLHGFGGGTFSWRMVASALARRCNTRVVMLDRPGFGLSERPYRHSFLEASNPYSLHTQVKIVLSLCEQLGLTKVLLVGHADGGLLSLMVASALMEGKKNWGVQVAGMVLVSPNLSSELVPTSTRLLLQTKLGRQMLRPLLRSEIGEVAIRRAWYDLSKLSRDVLELYKTPLKVEGWDRALYEVARLKREVDGSEVAQMATIVAGLPTAVLSGENDRVVAPDKCAAVAARLPGCVSRLVPSCGHLPHEESPSVVVGLLTSFVADVLGAGTSGPSGARL